MKKRKNRQTKKVTNSRELVSVSKEVNNQENSNVDKEQRRTTRLGALIALIAIVGTLCTILFKVAKAAMSIWPEKGIMYWYFIVLFLLMFSIAFILFGDMMSYIYSDLKRHNIANEVYEKYDEESDKKYLGIINDFEIYLVILAIVFAGFLFLNSIYSEGMQRISCIIVCIFLALLGIFILILYLRNIKKEVLKRKINKIASSIGKLFGVGLVSCVIILSLITSTTATIGIFCEENGRITITNTSSKSYERMEIKIYDFSCKTIIFQETVDEGNLLYARENEYILREINGKKEVEGIMVDGELLHWKYILELENIILKDGQYYVSICVYQEGESVEFKNMFDAKKGNYVYAKEVLEKDY